MLAALKSIKPEATRLSQVHGGLAAVLVDNVSAHYYIDRAIKSGAASGGGGGGAPLLKTAAVTGVAIGENNFNGPSTTSTQGVSLTLGKVHSAMMLGLRNLQHALRVPIIATKHVFSAGGRGSTTFDNAWVYRDVMLKPWQEFVTHRLVLKKLGCSGGGGGGGGGAGGSPQGHLAKWIKPEMPVDDKFRVGTEGIVAS